MMSAGLGGRGGQSYYWAQLESLQFISFILPPRIILCPASRVLGYLPTLMRSSLRWHRTAYQGSGAEKGSQDGRPGGVSSQLAPTNQPLYTCSRDGPRPCESLIIKIRHSPIISIVIPSTLLIRHSSIISNVVIHLLYIFQHILLPTKCSLSPLPVHVMVRGHVMASVREQGGGVATLPFRNIPFSIKCVHSSNHCQEKRIPNNIYITIFEMGLNI